MIRVEKEVMTVDCISHSPTNQHAVMIYGVFRLFPTHVFAMETGPCVRGLLLVFAICVYPLRFVGRLFLQLMQMAEDMPHLYSLRCLHVRMFLDGAFFIVLYRLHCSHNKSIRAVFFSTHTFDMEHIADGEA